LEENLQPFVQRFEKLRKLIICRDKLGFRVIRVGRLAAFEKIEGLGEVVQS